VAAGLGAPRPCAAITRRRQKRATATSRRATAARRARSGRSTPASLPIALDRLEDRASRRTSRATHDDLVPGLGRTSST
jgi:hypothetical protein